LAIALTLLPALAQAEVINRIVLRVNDRVATLKEYQDRMQEARRAVAARNLEGEQLARAMAALPQQVFRNLYEELLLLSRADQMDIRVPASAMEDAIAQVREANNLTNDEQLARALAQQGIGWEEYRQGLADQMRQREVVGREVYSSIELEEDDLRLFYRDNPELFQIPERRQLREVVVLETSPMDYPGRQRLAQEIRALLTNEENPEEEIDGYEEEGLTTSIIDLGWVEEGDLDSALAAAVEDLAPGEVSEPVEGRGGLHVIQVLAHEEEQVRPFDAVKDEIYARERQRILAQKLPEYLRGLEAKSYVVAQPPPEAEGFRTGWEQEPGSTDPLEAFRQSRAAAAEQGAAQEAPSSSASEAEGEGGGSGG
jgi:peptidyl-prolyl cis-trans isomerase SurA